MRLILIDLFNFYNCKADHKKESFPLAEMCIPYLNKVIDSVIIMHDVNNITS